MNPIGRTAWPLLWLPLAGRAADASSPASAGNLLQVLFGLIVVLGLMAAAAWVLKRIGAMKPSTGTMIRIIGGVSVGSRERVIVVEVADQWIVVGVAPGQVNALATMTRQESPPSAESTTAPPNFAAWLKKTIEKRNGN
ncbi:MAG TPA: flagellar biosynthetic protein FliO [Paucimonas sp.]|nr:flagellar biosynthetic protein FliO [Paucimonas sp.]HJW55009.1 flagellar biosynthetic protein FliO [Burkholderiaceae bacterium]